MVHSGAAPPRNMSAPSLHRTRFNSKPSILLVVVDDAYRLLFAAYGSPLGLTPAIDAIALSQNGAAMREAFSPSSVCSPARLSILTGRYPSEVQRASFFRANGTVPVGFDCCWGKRLADQPTIHRLLRGAGYRTAFMGKAHMANHPEELTDRDARREPDELLGALRGCLARRAAGETTAELFGDQACQQAYLRHQTGADEAAEISWTNIDDINRRSGGAVDFFHEPERMAEAGRAFVGRAVDAGVPFFLHLNPTLLHLPLGGRMMERLTNQSGPWRAQRRAAFARFSAADVSIDAVTGAATATGSAAAWPPDLVLGEQLLLAPNLGYKDGAEKWIGAQAAAAAWLDASLQPLLSAAARLENAITIFTSDHGPSIVGKATPYDGGARVPLLLRWSKHAVSDVDVQVRHVDWLPTLAEVAGVANVSASGGGDDGDGESRARALWPTAFAAGPVRTAADPPVFLENWYNRAVRHNGWKLILARIGSRCEERCYLHTIVQNEVAESRAASCPAAGSLINTAESCSGKLLHPHYCDAVQLYHLPTDPQEQHSLAGMAEHAARVHGLTKLLQRFEERRAKTHTQ